LGIKKDKLFKRPVTTLTNYCIGVVYSGCVRSCKLVLRVDENFVCYWQLTAKYSLSQYFGLE